MISAKRLMRKAAAPTLAAMMAFAIVLAGCDRGVLVVDDPDVVTPDQAEGPEAAPAAIAGMWAAWEEAWDDVVMYGGLLTDIYILAGTFPTRLEVDERRTLVDNATMTGELYGPLHRARQWADDMVEVFTAAQDDPDFDPGLAANGLAVGKTFAGWSRVIFAEYYCQSIMGGPDGESAPLLPDERAAEALAMLQDAETTAEAAGETDLVHAASLGQARAHMWLGDYDAAAAAVEDIPTEFGLTVDYSNATPSQRSNVFQQTWGAFGASLRWTHGDGTDGTRGNEEYPYWEEWVDLGLLIPPALHEEAAFNGESPVYLQTPHGGSQACCPELAGPGGEGNLLWVTGWEARMIEAEAMIRNGERQAAEDMVNDLLEDPDQSLNPMKLHQNANVPTGAFQPADFTSGTVEDALIELTRARQAGLFQSGERQGTLQRLFLQDGIDLYPVKPGSQVNLPVVQQELDNNPNISQGCPPGTPGR